MQGLFMSLGFLIEELCTDSFQNKGKTNPGVLVDAAEQRSVELIISLVKNFSSKLLSQKLQNSYLFVIDCTVDRSQFLLIFYCDIRIQLH